MAGKYFEGWYLKHQKAGDTVAFIPGIANDTAFIQIITNEKSYNVLYPASSYRRGGGIQIGDCAFSEAGVKIHIDQGDVSVSGEITYAQLTPIRYDIMGIFKYFPMECRHGIISMHHTLDGHVCLNGAEICLTGGTGYIEKDSGRSFPKAYLWIQCSDFTEKCAIMASIADIPFAGTHFRDCICVVCHGEKEYRLATYLGAKIESCSGKRVVLRQGKYRLEIDIFKNNGSPLYAPDQGEMTRTIRECVACGARFRFFKGATALFDLESRHASFEFVEPARENRQKNGRLS